MLMLGTGKVGSGAGARSLCNGGDGGSSVCVEAVTIVVSFSSGEAVGGVSGRTVGVLGGLNGASTVCEEEEPILQGV